ncbi:Nuclear factor related to kappa-B-binding protein [Camellia lanceoleosa]|uniref:Nuclear factor related to kappa-B-binding protein n=1 Tax=Camellia lanceoleosa TaxID=1840588 RepID=A0ACC0HTT1_9ERIC|nr:Nuclear factor related to kappa-B-binding protein [Camellia lanceoleosa]
MHDVVFLQNSSVEVLEDSYFNGDNDQKKIYKLGKNGQLCGDNKRFPIPSLKAHPSKRRQKGDFESDYSVRQSNYLHDFAVDEEDLLETRELVEANGVTGRLAKKVKVMEAYTDDCYERSDVLLSLAKKQKEKEDVTYNERDDNNCVHSNSMQQHDDTTSSKKREKRKLKDDSKKPFTLITPTVYSNFSFSIIHLLSAVRLAMITMLPEDSLEIGKDEQDKKQEGTNGVDVYENLDVTKSKNSVQLNARSLTVAEIIYRVRSNPGDPCIIETQEPLHDLVRGVLKIFSARTVPLGVKGWKPLAFYEKSSKSWSWIGPVSHSSLDHKAVEEVTSPETWGLPHRMLVKLVDSFAKWLKSGQETLRQIGSLPAPPSSLMQFNLDEKERFKDLRAQKSLNTISPSSEEKILVASLRMYGVKPSSRPRDHFMLKRDRPPHVTILCLVRDTTARLPGTIGTRADVCTLIRNSQYIMEDVSERQLNQVVSGALDRLHYERDPCVQFDGERKLWVYLHREREEEDFEDDGTSSTKKWKRQKKEDQETVTVAYDEAGEQTGFELSFDPNVNLSCMDEDKRMDLMYYDDKHNMEDNVGTSHVSEQGTMHQGHPMAWEESLGLNSMRENRLLYFDDETFGREPPAELLTTSLS